MVRRALLLATIGMSAWSTPASAEIGCPAAPGCATPAVVIHYDANGDPIDEDSAAPGACPAGATCLGSITAYPLTQRYLQAAEAYWHDAPGCDEVAVTLYDHPDPSIGGEAHDCTVWLDVLMWHESPWTCQLFAHEFGHLIGRTHDDPDPVMRTDASLYDHLTPQCAPPATAPPVASSAGAPAKGVNRRSKGGSWMAAEKRHRNRQALRWWQAGVSYGEIGRRLDISRVRARQIVRRELERQKP